MSLNLEKLARMEAHAEAANTAIRGMSETYREYVVHAQRLRTHAVANAPDVAHLQLSALNQIDRAELERFGVDLRALHAANLETISARELHARIERERAFAHPMNALLGKLRRYAAGSMTLIH